MNSEAATATAFEDLAPPPEVPGSRLRGRLLWLLTLAVIIVVLITLVPGLASLRSRFESRRSGLDRRRHRAQDPLGRLPMCSSFAACSAGRCASRPAPRSASRSLAPTPSCRQAALGGLALGAWALHRGGMPSRPDRAAERRLLLPDQPPQRAGRVHHRSRPRRRPAPQHGQCLADGPARRRCRRGDRGDDRRRTPGGASRPAPSGAPRRGLAPGTGAANPG